MSAGSGNIGDTCEAPDDMATTLSASVELEIPAPHAPKCACCASLDDALVVIASLRSQLDDRGRFEACLFGCSPDGPVAPRCPTHGSALRVAENPDD